MFEIVNSYEVRIVLASKEKKYVINNEKLMSEWHWEKNNEFDLNPEKLVCGSGKRAWWICEKGHEWEAIIRSRNKGYGCPYCSNRKVLAGYNDLATTNPKLAEQWNCNKNGSLTPQDVVGHSNKKVWWICEKGHEWETSINSRSNGNGCPYCSGRMAWAGHNDLVTVNSNLAKEWHPTKNNSLKPSDVTPYSNKKVWWICEKGHEWEALVYGRSNGNGCPYCNSENHTSFAEQAIYFYCKKVTNAINRYTDLGKEIDVYLPEYNVGIEYNGSYWHKNREQRDYDKLKYFADKGIKIITVKEGNKNLVEGNVIKYIYNRSNKTHLNFVIESIFNLIGIKLCKIDVDKDSNEILEQYIRTKRKNSIAIKNKNSIIEWNYEKNGSLLPTMFSYGSNKIMWWKCKKCKHEWQSSISNYMRRTGCPECAKKRRFKRKTLCVDTKIIYNSISEASMKTGISTASIIKCCKGEKETAGGYHWEYVDKH